MCKIMRNIGIACVSCLLTLVMLGSAAASVVDQAKTASAVVTPNNSNNISLNFQDIEVRAVLQLLADFTDQNMVLSDAIQGKISLHLDNIPWEQALDFILVARGLGKRHMGNTLLIAPLADLTAREQLTLETRQQAELLEPLEAKYMQINFAKAQDLLTIIKDSQTALLSSRGQATADARTNTIFVKDLAANIRNIRRLIKQLDVPVRQVMIETQIVETVDALNYALGLKFNGQRVATQSQTQSMPAAPTDKLFFDFAAAAGAKLGLTVAHLPGGTLLDLELQASESEGKSKTVARPKLLTLNQQSATIETGTEIPYVTTAQQGASPTTIFKKAALRLEVTPQITPNNKVAMRLYVNNDTPGQVLDGTSEPSINTTSLTTNVLVDNGETIVLGGIFKLVNNSTRSGIPYLHTLPFLGKLFEHQRCGVTRTEVLIFVTPRIVQHLPK